MRKYWQWKVILNRLLGANPPVGLVLNNPVDFTLTFGGAVNVAIEPIDKQSRRFGVIASIPIVLRVVGGDWLELENAGGPFLCFLSVIGSPA